MRDDAGVVLRMVGTVQDITARKEAEAELRASEALARENIQRVQLALAAGAIIGTWHWDIPSDRFTIDDAFAHSFGLDPALGRDGIPLDQIVATVHRTTKRVWRGQSPRPSRVAGPMRTSTESGVPTDAITGSRPTGASSRGRMGPR